MLAVVSRIFLALMPEHRVEAVRAGSECSLALNSFFAAFGSSGRVASVTRHSAVVVPLVDVMMF